MLNDSQRLGRKYVIIGCLFFVSGFCSLLYQTIWLRLAFAKFGVITPVVSLVVSLFMLGLALGSRLGGRYVGTLTNKTGRSGLFFYAIVELVTALGGVVVPVIFAQAEACLLTTGSFDSSTYLALSALAIGVSILPWAIAMGATFPFGLAYLKEFEVSSGQGADSSPSTGENNFGFLYVANVAGAVFGASIPVLVLIEFMGFEHCLMLGSSLNVLIALVAFFMSKQRGAVTHIEADAKPVFQKSLLSTLFGLNGSILFSTGLISMAMEVGWIRLFTPVLGTVVYSFASVLTSYLFSTFVGSYLYRLSVKSKRVLTKAQLMLYTAGAAFIPIVLNDPRSGYPFPGLIALLSIMPFCAALGYLTPLIIDELSMGDPEFAGSAYAVNVVGGIIGPLLIAYLLLPLVGVKLSIILLGVPLVVVACVAAKKKTILVLSIPAVLVYALMIGSLSCWSWEERLPTISQSPEIHRDYAATTICASVDGNKKRIFVNGISMTELCKTTKYMAHAPLAMLPKAKDVLVICFGMGTTFRSMLTWPVNVTAVELIPGVKACFHYFWSDADQVLKNPRGQIVIDDGRRYLKRTDQQFDLITVDPPPPVPAAGSSLLYSTDFYKVVNEHLKPGGIFCQWYPIMKFDDKSTLPAVTKSIAESFKYVKVYTSVEGIGYHFFCSQSPIPEISPDNMWQRMPDAAKKDMLEFENNDMAQAQRSIQKFLSSNIPINSLYDQAKDSTVSDDRPYNEYFLIRYLFFSSPEPAANAKAIPHSV